MTDCSHNKVNMQFLNTKFEQKQHIKNRIQVTEEYIVNDHNQLQHY